MDGIKGKGGYWTIDPAHMERFKNGSFVRGSSSLLRRRTTLQSSPSPPTSLPGTPSSSQNHISNPITKEPCPVMQIQNLLN